MKILRTVFHLTCFILFILSIGSVFLSNHSQGAEVLHHNKEEPSAYTESSANIEKMVSDLEKKKVELDAKEKNIAEQEKLIKSREEDLDKKFKELENIRTGLASSFEAQKKNNEEKVMRIVTVIETMQPKAAAQMMETLDDWLAVDVVKRMDTKKIAKIMNLMEKNRSAKLSELLTGYYHPQLTQKELTTQSVAKTTGQNNADGVDASKGVNLLNKGSREPAKEGNGNNSTLPKN